MTDINSKIKNYNSKDPVVLYMKGNPTFPQCGFSSTVVQILKHIGVNFQSYDVLQDENLREGIKSFSNWPTIPQLYVNSEFVGGCDIIREMFESGELKEFEKDIKNKQIQFTKIGRIVEGVILEFADNSFINIDELKKLNKL